jgi:ANTAR domain/GAF domain
MPIDSFAMTVTRIASASSWSSLTSAAHDAVTCLGGTGSSLGILEDGVVRQAARGFDARLATRYASIPVAEALPGPAALRTGAPQLLEDRATTLARYPAAAPILEGSEFEAAACLPLMIGDVALGYLAAHYRGPRQFDPVDVMMLGIAAAACAGVVSRVLRVHPEGDRGAPVAAERLDHAQAVERLQGAIANRASIEQAKGMLMQRYEIGPQAAWAVLRRLSDVLHVKVWDLADRLVDGDAVDGLSERFIAETIRD